MNQISLVRDSAFLKQLDLSNIKVYYVQILVLDKEEQPLRAIQGRVSTGSISIDGNSSIRRSGSLTFLAEETENDLTDVDNLLSLNKKIKILIGIENNIDTDHYDKIIWFNQGIFVITQPNLSHTTQGVNINLSFKDKMCLLNGECGGGLPTSVTFSEYEQQIGYEEIVYSDRITYPDEPNPNLVYGFLDKATGKITYMMYNVTVGWVSAKASMVGTTVSVPQRLYDIIQTLVCNYGGEAIAKIIINDVPLEIKNSVRFVGSDYLYYNTETGVYTLDEEVAANTSGEWKVFGYNEDCGFIYTDLVYPGQLVSSIGENICNVLDKIKTVLGNYEYFYDVEGNFVFQEIKNYLNTQYEPVQKLDENGFLLNNDNYYVDFSNISNSVYTFDESSALISSYSNAPNYNRLKNDYHIWGKAADGFAIHYHLAIKEKPFEPFESRMVVDEIIDDKYTGRIRLAKPGEAGGYEYIPTDWRAELYLRGLEKKSLQQRPDMYEQELLDLFDTIYDMRLKEFKVDVVNNPNNLKYWIDYLEPYGDLHDVSIDSVGIKIHSYQQDKIKRLYNTDIPNVILINSDEEAAARASLIMKCESAGQPYSNVTDNIYKNLALGQVGYSSQEVARDLMYQYTDYISSISITSIPIYYLNVNTRISVYDRAAGIYGDYIIKSINIPLDAKNTMTISATKALERI